MYNEIIIDIDRVSSLDRVHEFIKYLRKGLGLTQQEVAEGSGFSVVTVSKFENGKCNRNGVASACITNYILQEAGITAEEALEAYSVFVNEAEPIELKN